MDTYSRGSDKGERRHTAAGAIPDQPKDQRTGRGRVDREQAFHYWASLSLDTRSYAAVVATQFAISPRTVERYSREGGWRQRLAKIETEAATQADERLGRGAPNNSPTFGG